MRKEGAVSTQMTEDEQTLLMIKGTIAEQPQDVQALVAMAANSLRTTISTTGQRHPGAGLIAMALVGAEAQLGMLQG